MAEKKQVYANDIFMGLTVPVRVLFNPHLATPVKIGGKGDAKYEVQIGFPKDHPDVVPMKQEMARIAREKWGPSFDLKKLQLKFVDGDEEFNAIANHPDPAKRKQYNHLKGLTLMKLRSANPISVFDVRQRDAKGVPVLISDEAAIRRTIYAGCYVSLTFTFSTYDEIVDRDPAKSRPPGISVWPEKICFVADGERLTSGGKEDGSGFASVQGAVSAQDPTGASDDPLAGF